jgi:glycosyltransferase involved in cell wall biosynthesis
MNLSVVVCTRNRAESLRRMLRSLSEVGVPPDLQWEVLVVDNNSADDTKRIVELASEKLPCRYLFESRQGKSFALNTAIRQSRGDIIAFTDDDAVVNKGWLTAVWRAFSEHDCIGLGGRVLPVWNTPQPSWYSKSEPYRLMAVIVEYDGGDVSADVLTPPFGANMAFRRIAFAKYGMFRTDLAGEDLMRGEDTEFCRRVMGRGERLIYIPDALLFHPVEEYRLTKRYFQSWYYDYGRMIVRRDASMKDTVCWFGVPRYVFRELACAVFRFSTSFNSKKRFFHKLECYQLLGQIAEARRRKTRAISQLGRTTLCVCAVTKTVVFKLLAVCEGAFF